MQIINKSLSTCEFPQAFKNALATLLLKKRTLDEYVLNNYQPVTNLTFISKVTEKVVASRLNHHLMVNNLQEPFQSESAYRMNHSTETAMLRVQNDIVRALGDSNVVPLVLIDLSAAFDTNGYSTLCMQSASPAKHSHGLRLSYLQNRSQTITISGKQSQQLECGVPQGSVLGPILFNVYTAALGLLHRQENTNYSMWGLR